MGRLKVKILAIIGCLVLQSTLSIAQNEIKTIVIDAGHGGHDPGNLGTGRYKITEKDISLDVALKVGEYIKDAYPNIKIIYTRKDDRFIQLHERAAVANRNKADLFISIHCNAAKATSAAGTETWVMGLHRSKENLDVAMRENSVILMEDNYESTYADFNPRDPDSYIAMSLMQSAYLDQSVVLASKVQEDFGSRVGRTNRGIKQGGLLVLYKSAMPAILIELGFLTNAAEEDFLHSSDGKVYMASSIFRAFKSYKEITETIYGGSASSKPEEKVEKPKVEKKEPVKVYAQEIDKQPTNESKESPKSDHQVLFKVQFLTSPQKHSTNSAKFNGLTDVEIHRVNNLYKYTSGKFANYDEAKEWLKSVRESFPSSFVVAMVDGDFITIQAAKNLLEASKK